MANEANWPVVGGEYRNRSYTVSARVTAIEGDQVSATYIHPNGCLGGNVLPVTASVFRKSFLPADQSPIPALTKALKDSRSMIEDYYGFARADWNAKPAYEQRIADQLTDIDAALALVEASNGL